VLKFKPGDVVRLASGGRDMVVGCCRPAQPDGKAVPTVTCLWCEHSKVATSEFPEGVLVLSLATQDPLQETSQR
jgi:uncharacterized protein YodC (DUF2158 family)